MKYIVVDLEATNGATNSIVEVIEFGYTVVEEDKIITRGGEYIKPLNSTLDRFIEELTGITEECLKDAKTFKEFVYEVFLNGFNPEDFIFVSWGEFDWQMIIKMCNLYNIPLPQFKEAINLKKHYKDFYKLTKERGLTRALNARQIPFDGRHHSGADDAYNTAKLMLKMMSEGWCHYENKEKN